MIVKLYHALLWLLGFAPGEHITDMLRRQKRRLGFFWWLGLAGGSGFFAWLILHILEVC